MEKEQEYYEKELQILRNAVDEAKEITARETINNPDVKKIIHIIEKFLKKKKLICYGGTAINNILPESDQFYDRDLELPDYDFYSPNALEDAKLLSDIYYKNGYTEVEAKSGVHHGTFKVFVNFMPIADITYLPTGLYNSIKKEVIVIEGISYAPPNLLRMGMYLELSRPAGDISRWEKVFNRLVLLNKNYPLQNEKCNTAEFMRSFENNGKNKKDEADIYEIVKNNFMDQGLVFFGGFANILYSKYMPKSQQQVVKKIPDFDVLSNEPLKSADLLKQQLEQAGYNNVKVSKKTPVGEIIATHYAVQVGEELIAFIYEPLGCHSYNTIKINGKEIKVATIDTMLSLYLAFLYANKPYYDKDRILCMSQYLFTVQHKNKLKQRGLLKRFSVNCYGTQETLTSLRAKKMEKFQELKNKRNTEEYEEWFLRYVPHQKKQLQKARNKMSSTKISSTFDLTPTPVKSSTQKLKSTRSRSKASKKSMSSKRKLAKSSKQNNNSTLH